MPIRFEQPNPMGSGLSFAGGQAQGINQGMDNVLRAYSIASENSRANLAAHQRQAESMGDRELKARMFQQQQMMQMREAEQNSRIEAQLALQDLHFTQREQSRLNQLQQGLAGVREMLTAGQITPEAAQEMEVQIRTGMSGLGVKKAVGELAIQDLTKKRLAEDTRYNEGLREETAKFRAKSLSERFVTNEIPGIGTVLAFETEPGKFTTIQGKSEAQALGETKAEWGKNYKEIRKEVQDYLVQTRDFFRDDPKVPKPPSQGGHELENPAKFKEQLDTFTAQMLSERHGAYANWPQELDRIMKMRGQRGRPQGGGVPGQVAGMAGDISTGAMVAGMPNAGAPPEALEGPPGAAHAAGPMGARPISPRDREVPPAVAESKPFKMEGEDWFNKLSPPQKTRMVELNSASNEFDDKGRFTPDEQRSAKVWIGTVRDLLAHYGHESRIDNPQHMEMFRQAVRNIGILQQKPRAKVPAKDVIVEGSSLR